MHSKQKKDLEMEAMAAIIIINIIVFFFYSKLIFYQVNPAPDALEQLS